MILETNEIIEDELVYDKIMVNKIWCNNISLYIDYFDTYSTMMNIVYNGHNRIVINSSVSFFINFRNYILFSNDIKFDRWLVSRYFDKMLSRFIILLHKSNQKIYVYKASLEIIGFCDYYNFNYIVIDNEKELQEICRDIV